jgi:hypothetical protein
MNYCLKIIKMEDNETSQLCKLCINFRLPPKPDTSVRKCIDPKCDQKYYNSTPNELVDYYLNFLRLTLSERPENKKYRTLLGRKFSSKFSRSNVYQVAWNFFVEEVINNQDGLDISRVGVYYSRGIGVRRSAFMADLFFALAEKYRTLPLTYTEEGDICPVCTINPDNGDGSIICDMCTKMVCGFCYKRLPNKRCPSCTSDLNDTLINKIQKLRKAIETRRGRNIENAKVFLGWAILKCPSEANYQAYALASEAIMRHCDKGYFLLGSMYLSGKGCVQNILTAVKILETGAKKNQTECMIELGRIYNNGTEVKKNKYKSIDFYKLAALNGNQRAFQYLHQLKCG